MLSLIDIAKEKGADDRVKAYWNTYHCQNLIYTSESRMYAPHCKNRFCTYCCGIRKADVIRRYLPVLQTWEDPHFVTLTVKAVRAGKLPVMIAALNRAFRQIKRKYDKRGERGTDYKLVGVRSMECNFNPKTKTYNPHFHLIVPSEAIAELLVAEWLKKWTRQFASRSAQHYRRVEDRERDLVEVIKYEAKIFTEPDGKKRKGNSETTTVIYARALDNIYAAMKGCRLIDRFGFNLPKESKREKAPSQLVDECVLWQYDLKSRDWVSEDHECTLTTYSPPVELVQLLEMNIDTVME